MDLLSGLRSLAQNGRDYLINKSTLSPAFAGLIKYLENLSSSISNKQDKLEAGENIKIEGKKISATTSPGGGSYTDEEAQDAVGTILSDGTTDDVEFVYNDASPLISGKVKKVGGATPSVIGKNILSAADAAAVKALLSIVSTDIGDSTAAGRAVLTSASVAAIKTLLAIASTDITDSTSIGRSILTGVSDSAIRTILSAQLTDADLDAIAALTPSNDDFLQRKSGAWTNRTVPNVIDDTNTTIYSYKRSGKWYHQGRNMTALGTTFSINNTSNVSFCLLEIGRSVPITDIAIEVTTALAGALLYFGIYKVDYPSWTSGPLIASASGISGATIGLKSVTLSSPVTLTPGLYLTAVSHNGVGSITFRSIGVGGLSLIGITNVAGTIQASGYTGSRAVPGALPNNLSGYTSFAEALGTSQAVFWMKVQ